ncbi:MAG: LPS export ABC transporter periplasmic protein LptC [Flavobacteriaceae bacterium]|jgi:LPS export ABC transporter protein LptC
MNRFGPQFRLYLLGLFLVALTRCVDTATTAKQIVEDRQIPLGTANNIRMVYTDSAKVQAILTAPKHVDYTNLSFQYSLFPEGLKVVFYDQLGNQSELIADYGTLYNDSKLIDLKGNVVLTSNDGGVLKTDQLFWDADAEWMFTEQPFTFQDNNYDFEAVRLDADKEFTKFQTGKLLGTIKVSENPTDSIAP